MNVQLILLVNDLAVPTHKGSDAYSKLISFYPEAKFAIHVILPSDFHFLADVLILSTTMNGTPLSTFHVRPNAAGDVLEGIVRSPALLFPPEPHNHGQIVVKLSHARASQPKVFLPELPEEQVENVVDVPSSDAEALGVIPLEYPEQQTFTFRWNYRSLDALREAVQGARTQKGPEWTDDDEIYIQRQRGVESGGNRKHDDYLLKREGEEGC